jgi:hypothetical protein
MQLTIKNQTANSLSYVQGFITVAANSSAVVPRQYNVLLTGDGGFLADAVAGNIVVNNGYVDLAAASIILLAQTLASFATTPTATIPLYYSLPVSIRQSAGTASGSVVWAMRNNSLSPKIVIIERIDLVMSFDSGTPLLRQSLQYEFVRFSAATPTGGTQITPIMMDSNSPSTLVTDARYLDTGLATSGVSFENAFASVGCPASDGAVSQYHRSMPIKLGRAKAWRYG